MRNAIGQKIEVGTPVVVVSQGQGWTALGVGRVEKFSKNGIPQVRYVGSNNKHYAPGSDGYKGERGKLSPPIQRYERMFVITEEQFKDLAETKAILEQSDHDFRLANPQPDIDDYRSKTNSTHWGWDWKTPNSRQEFEDAKKVYEHTRREYINAAMRAAGKDNYYD